MSAVKRFIEDVAEEFGWEVDDPKSYAMADKVMNLMETMIHFLDL